MTTSTKLIPWKTTPVSTNDDSPKLTAIEWFQLQQNNAVSLYGNPLTHKLKENKTHDENIKYGLPAQVTSELNLLGIPIKTETSADPKFGIIHTQSQMFPGLRIIFSSQEIINFFNNTHHVTIFEVYFGLYFKIEDIRIQTSSSAIKRQCPHCLLYYDQKKYMYFKCPKHLCKRGVKCSKCNLIKRQIKTTSYEHHKCVKNDITPRMRKTTLFITCTSCPFKCRYKSEMSTHKCGIMPYTCKKCNHSFDKKSYYDKHMYRSKCKQ